jgi:hypothetical protein
MAAEYTGGVAVMLTIGLSMPSTCSHAGTGPPVGCRPVLVNDGVLVNAKELPEESTKALAGID